MTLQNILKRIRIYFNLKHDMEDEAQIVEQIRSGISFKGANLWVLIFAILIASLGLNVNSTAVIIGAMLISPLMGPIIGLGLAVGINDLDLLKRSAKSYGVATLISVLTATIYFLLTPLSEVQSELLARTSPSLYDVLIAFCGGAAGIIALCTRGKGNVIPGVAIATALMPPLCTAGFGIATGHLLYFLGAFYLFFINTVFIALATYGGVRVMHFHRQEFPSHEMAVKTKRILVSIVIITMLPAAFLTFNIVKKSIIENNVSKFVKMELAQHGTQIISTSIDKDNLGLHVVAVGREISTATQVAAERKMDNYGLRNYHLRIIQGSQSDSLLSLNKQLTDLTSTRESERKELHKLSAENTLLNSKLDEYKRYETLANDIQPEMSTLFPQVKNYTISKVLEYNYESYEPQTYVSVVIQTFENKALSKDENVKLRHWLKSRLDADSLVVIHRY